MPDKNYKNCDDCAIYHDNGSYYDDINCPSCKQNWHLDDNFKPMQAEEEKHE